MKNRFGIKTKLLVLSVGLALLTPVVATIGQVSNRQVESEYKFIVEKSVPKLELANEMFLNYRQVRIMLRTLGLPNLSKAEAEASIEGAVTAIQKYEAANASYVALGFVDKQKALYDTTQVAWEDFKKVGARVIGLYKTGTPESMKSVISIFLTECPEKAEVYSASILALNAFHKSNLGERVVAAKTGSHEAAQLSWTIIVVALVIGLSLGFVLSNSTAKELKAIADDLVGNANEVSGAVSNLTSSSSALSAAATDQATAIQHTAASIEEIRAMVQQSTDNAVQSAKISAQSKAEANDGQTSVRDMIVAMQDIHVSNQNIQDEVESGNRRISEIVKIIQEIETKTNVINDIVFQTKLLSFNASVEAARAGEHGKGFAVVAEEVGNLANMSGNAAKEISGLLAESSSKVSGIVQETTTKVKSLMDLAKTKVERGNQVAETCGHVLEKIVSNADQLSQMVENISSAGREQASGVTEIASAIEQLNEATQTNAAETQNTSSAAVRLGGQVKSLNGSSHRLKMLIEGGVDGNGARTEDVSSVTSSIPVSESRAHLRVA